MLDHAGAAAGSRCTATTTSTASAPPRSRVRSLRRPRRRGARPFAEQDGGRLRPVDRGGRATSCAGHTAARDDRLRHRRRRGGRARPAARDGRGRHGPSPSRRRAPGLSRSSIPPSAAIPAPTCAQRASSTSWRRRFTRRRGAIRHGLERRAGHRRARHGRRPRAPAGREPHARPARASAPCRARRGPGCAR